MSQQITLFVQAGFLPSQAPDDVIADRSNADHETSEANTRNKGPALAYWCEGIHAAPGKVIAVVERWTRSRRVACRLPLVIWMGANATRITRMCIEKKRPRLRPDPLSGDWIV